MTATRFLDLPASPLMTALDAVAPPEPGSLEWSAEYQQRIHWIAEATGASLRSAGEVFDVLRSTAAGFDDPLSMCARNARDVIRGTGLDPDAALLTAWTWRRQRGRGDGYDIYCRVPRLESTRRPVVNRRGQRDSLPTVIDNYEPTSDLQLMLDHRGGPVGDVVAARVDGRGLHVWARLHREHTALAAASLRGSLSCSAGFHLRNVKQCTGFQFADAVVTEVSLCRSEDAAFPGATVEPSTPPPGERPWPAPAQVLTYVRQHARSEDGQVYTLSAPFGRITAVH